MQANVEQFLAPPLVSTVGQPLRVAVYSRLVEGIRSGTFPTGLLLPRETELGASLGVSRTVVREALMLLEEDGLVLTRRGVGRFVTESASVGGLEGLRPPEAVVADGILPATVRPIEFSLQHTTDFVSRHLDLEPLSTIWFRESLLFRGESPVAVVQEYLPAGPALAHGHPRIAEALEAAAATDATLFSALLLSCGPIFGRGVCEVRASIAGDTRGHLLGISPSQPVLTLTQTAEVPGKRIYLAKCIISPKVGKLSIVQSNTS